MSEDKIPEWDRARREIQSQMRGMWDEIERLTDWSWKNEQSIDSAEARLTMLEKQYRNLRREFEEQ